ncbi:Glyoxalase-like domain-containing protein [Aliiroseovarius sediminilitoris]|uniref:Glyoxalase-like domain-containing protein n=1 Tax=Aliiroseovarius sediminilitoris TaxID=1173584 RepID=A0A1I0QMQ2_9RHOB|nr:VOC family protein [Aliiroseovarius sediminilitoris]SEW28042.1 Glyoxalase-like domain-containing protein [Aliiroseovarius sediminilitoris]
MALGEIDHLVVSSATLTEGVACIEDLLGVPMAGGGEHPLMGTHNALLSLGPSAYLEVIAINPDAPAPSRARWFDLDYFTGPARLTNWALRVPDLHEALHRAPDGMGDAIALERGDYAWDMAIPQDGRLPFSGCAPGLLSWKGRQPAPNLPDHGLRLAALEITHPEAEALSVALAPLIADGRISVHTGTPGLTAWLDTANGLVKLP